MIHIGLKNAIQQDLSFTLKQELEIEEVTPRGGGSINDTFLLKTNILPLFLKVNSASKFPEMFEMEAQGLETLIQTNTFHVPKPVTIGNHKDFDYLVMTQIESGNPGNDFWEDFAKKLAELHQFSSKKFGFANYNYIGSLSQSNKEHDDWVSFFIEERLQPLVRQATDMGEMSEKTGKSFDALYKQLQDFFPVENPSLIHGDLWSGNYMSDSKGEPVIYDPAVYFGHREMDIAMSRLFGGFDNQFYDAYNEHFPMEDGWRDRLEVCNLYPLLVHVILFGGSYINDVQRILKRFAA